MDSIALAEKSWRMLDALLDELDNVNHVRQVGRVMDNLKEIRFKLTVCRDGDQTKETNP
jgi:Zn-dependent M32 family carboxypeptidase